MRTVEDEDGRRLLVVKRAAESWLVRDPETGAERYADPVDLTAVDDAAPLSTAARGLDPDARRLVLAARDDRALGLLCHLDADGPRSVVGLLEGTDLCESDLHGLLAEFRAAELVEERRVDGRRGYGLSAAGEAALDRLR